MHYIQIPVVLFCLMAALILLLATVIAILAFLLIKQRTSSVMNVSTDEIVMKELPSECNDQLKKRVEEHIYKLHEHARFITVEFNEGRQYEGGRDRQKVLIQRSIKNTNLTVEKLRKQFNIELDVARTTRIPDEKPDYAELIRESRKIEILARDVHP